MVKKFHYGIFTTACQEDTMRTINICSRLTACIIFSMSLLVFAGCVPTSMDQQIDPVEDAQNKGRLSFFLNLFEVDGPDLSMQITAVSLKTEEGILVTHTLDSLVVESGKIKSGQKFIARMAVTPGRYTQVRLVHSEAGHVREQDTQLIPLKNTEAVMDLRSPLDIVVGDSKSLFFTWDTKQSLQDNKFYPAVQVAPSLKKLVADVAYVACPDIDTVFMVSTEQNRVIDSLGIPGGPAYLFQSGDLRSDDVNVLASKGLHMYVFSPATNRLTAKYNLTLINKPVHAAFSPNGRWGYILDQQLGTLSRMDMSSGTLDKQVQLNFDPLYILYLEKYNLLAVSLSVAQTVVLLQADTLEQTRVINTGSSPDGMRLVEERLLYIAEKGANGVMVYDLETDTLLKRVTVGFQPRRIFHTNNFVYVANYGDNSITAFRHGRLVSSRTIPFPGKPLEMAYEEKFNWFYVGNQQTMSLEVLNSLTNVVVDNIELGAVPQGILVMRDNNTF